ncbi:helix-turn-helix transcriptional regulator [Leucobacter chromiiresistens]|uniref:DNA-binding response regulator, NarL/FixJ family, contains REC and HTH domains n=3 Tax=Leucobacter chromiiresistens TaxID=1079994 RepID=A0A1H0YFE1_9MICO|nr:helix-turn-helix transcriptional regulator [Leucobacter chromiiresistens]SDQ13842.1 DNA-binding response regulator, NarL/FixJ family, contains REC and HTH domains [Leucobacter chromiiresistens]
MAARGSQAGARGDRIAVPRRRLHDVVEAARPEGSVTVLIGEAGNGKGYLAEQAALALAAELPGACAVEVLPRPSRPASGIPSVFPGGAAAERSGGSADDAARPPPEGADGDVGATLGGVDAGAPVILVAPDIDEYPPHDLRVLAELARTRTVRIIATARQLSSAIDRVGSGPQVQRLSIGALDLEESAGFLCSMLGVDRIDADTLARWHAVSGGNAYALAVLALAADRAGDLRRSRGTAWAARREDVVTGEYARLLAASCTEPEWQALEFIAQAEPIFETALLRSIDAGVLTALFERGLVVTQTRAGAPTLTLGHPLLAASVRAAMSPVRRIELDDRIFGVLDEDRAGGDPVADTERLIRLVVFGTAAGRRLPFPWVWRAFESLARGGDPRLVLRLARSTAEHPDADGAQAGSAALRAVRIGRLLGDEPARRAALDRVAELLADAALRATMAATLEVALITTVLQERVRDGGDLEAALGELDALEARTGHAAARAMVGSARVQVLAEAGRLREAAEACPPLEVSADLGIEWARSPGRAMASLILDQRGAVEQAVASAEHARALSRLGPHSRSDLVDIQGFCTLLGYWVSGSRESARRVYEGLAGEASADAHAEAHYSGLVEVGAVLLAVQEGRWMEAVGSGERLADRLASSDPYALAPLVQAALGLALAVLGERDGAMRAIGASESPQRGVSMAVGGHRRVLALRARQWLRDPRAADEAARIADWAARERLPYIELLARHARAYETRAVEAGELTTAERLAAQIDGPLGVALLAHLSRIARAPGSGAPAGVRAAAGEEPEIRLLADLGIWLPMPPAPDLTPREREIVLLAALGYSSRFIAERLTISARTVETHLSHAFAKIGVENRDELREWVARNRTAMTPPRST